MTHPELFLGIDIGTQGVRAVVVTAEGDQVGAGSRPLVPGLRSPGRHEQDPQTWWEALGEATRQALAPVAGRPVSALSLDSTSGTILVQGSDLAARTPGLMYDDARGAEQAVRAQETGRALWDELGYRIQASWALPRALWLVESDLVGLGDRIVHQGDYLLSRLAGRWVATDTSSALKTGCDPRDGSWPAEIFDRLGLDPALLPELVFPGTVIGAVDEAASAATGIPAGTVIKAGMTDGCAAQIAAGALAPGAWSSALGTTLVIKGSTAELLRDPSGAVYCHRSPDGGWLPGGASSTGAGIIARDFAGLDLGELTEAAAGLLPLAGVCYPLAGTGERFPFVAPSATGFSSDVPDTVEGRFAATLQGIALVEKLAYQTLSRLGADVSGPVTLSGGTTANSYFNQLRSDILNRPVRIPESVEAAVGMAILAAAEPGHLAGTAERMVRISREYQPDPVRGATFDEPYRHFVDALVERGWLDRPEG
ncbi:carbohydrate kinase [Nakamurella silvestris]|nr:carbohydrate kinase [Nakamurella silvestris]